MNSPTPIPTAVPASVCTPSLRSTSALSSNSFLLDYERPLSASDRWYPYRPLCTSPKDVCHVMEYCQEVVEEKHFSFMSITYVAPFSERGNKLTSELCGEIRVLGSRLESLGHAILVLSINASSSTLRHIMKQDIWSGDGIETQYASLKQFVLRLEDKIAALSGMYNNLVPTYYDVCERVKILCRVCNRRSWSSSPAFDCSSKDLLLKHGVMGAQLADFTELAEEISIMMEGDVEEDDDMIVTERQGHFWKSTRRYHNTVAQWEQVVTKSYRSVLTFIERFRPRSIH